MVGTIKTQQEEQEVFEKKPCSCVSPLRLTPKKTFNKISICKPGGEAPAHVFRSFTPKASHVYQLTRSPPIGALLSDLNLSDMTITTAAIPAARASRTSIRNGWVSAVTLRQTVVSHQPCISCAILLTHCQM